MIDQVDSVVVVPEEGFTLDTFEQLLHLLSEPGDTVVLPWLPLPRMLAVGHRLGRTLYAGDASPRACQAAITASSLPPERITDGLPTTLAG